MNAVYIHGIGHQPPAGVWKSQWDLALFGRPMGERTCGAYWADILSDESDRERASSKSIDLDEFGIRTLMKEAGLDWKNDRAFSFVSRLCTRLDLASQNSFESMSVGPLPSPRRSNGRLASSFLQRFVKDTASYFFDLEARKRVKYRLLRQIPNNPKSLTIVSHSLGTVIAYEVLSELTIKQRKAVSLFVTLGSPLGVREIQDKLIEDGIPIRVPPGIGAWHNFADRFDPVALDTRLANDFPVPSEAFGEVRDHLIINRSLGSSGSVNPHDSASYLSNPEVRSVVHEATRFDSTGRFVVARDVAQGFAAGETRQPVLIEVLEWKYPAVDESDEEMGRRESEQCVQSSLLKSMVGRVDHLALAIIKIVKSKAPKNQEEESVSAARVQRLRKYVAAHLTPEEIQTLAMDHANLNIYAMWRSSTKSKLIHRSHRTIGADAARASFKARGSGITWAVLDTGCRFDHPHFRKLRTAENNAFGNSLIINVLDCTTDADEPESIEDPDLADPDGHGTHVCGIITGAGREKQVAYNGVAPRTRLLVYKVLNDHGVGEDAWIIKAIDDIFRRNENNSGLAIHGVNLSLGGPFDATVYGCGFSPICKELRDLWRQGTLVCVAAGNSGQIQISTQNGPFDLNTTLSIGDPANLEDCIAVGSVNTDKPYLYGISHFSSRGPTTDGRVKPDVVAPGERISSCSNTPNGRLYRESSGTSMACPHVSGILAAFLSVRREFIGRPDEVKKILLKNCNDLGRDRHHQGHGIPNLLKMLTET